MMLKLTSLIPRPHPAFCAVRMLVVVFVHLRGESGNEARSYHPQSDTSYTTQQTIALLITYLWTLMHLIVVTTEWQQHLGAVQVLRLLCEVVVVVMSSRLIILVTMDISGIHCAYSSNS